MDRITTTDLYEASFYAVNGAQLDAVSCIPAGGKPVCQFTFSGAELSSAHHRYFTNEAVVNLLAFRQAYMRISQVMIEAKKAYKQTDRVR